MKAKEAAKPKEAEGEQVIKTKRGKNDKRPRETETKRNKEPPMKRHKSRSSSTSSSTSSSSSGSSSDEEEEEEAAAGAAAAATGAADDEEEEVKLTPTQEQEVEKLKKRLEKMKKPLLVVEAGKHSISHYKNGVDGATKTAENLARLIAIKRVLSSVTATTSPMVGKTLHLKRVSPLTGVQKSLIAPTIFGVVFARCIQPSVS